MRRSTHSSGAHSSCQRTCPCAPTSYAPPKRRRCCSSRCITSPRTNGRQQRFSTSSPPDTTARRLPHHSSSTPITRLSRSSGWAPSPIPGHWCADNSTIGETNSPTHRPNSTSPTTVPDPSSRIPLVAKSRWSSTPTFSSGSALPHGHSTRPCSWQRTPLWRSRSTRPARATTSWSAPRWPAGHRHPPSR